MMEALSTTNHRPIGVNRIKRGPRSGEDAREWQAKIRGGNGKNVYLGLFDTQEEAARAYDNAAYYLQLAGRKAVRLNFPDEYSGRRDSPPPTEKTMKAVELYKTARASRRRVREMRGDADVQSALKNLGLELSVLGPLLGGPNQFEAACQWDKVMKHYGELVTYLSSPATGNSQPVTASALPVAQSDVSVIGAAAASTQSQQPQT